MFIVPVSSSLPPLKCLINWTSELYIFSQNTEEKNKEKVIKYKQYI